MTRRRPSDPVKNDEVERQRQGAEGAERAPRVREQGRDGHAAAPGRQQQDRSDHGDNQQDRIEGGGADARELQVQCRVGVVANFPQDREWVGSFGKQRLQMGDRDLRLHPNLGRESSHV